MQACRIARESSLLLHAYAELLDTVLDRRTPRDVGAAAVENMDAIAGELHLRAGRTRRREPGGAMGALIRLVIDERVGRYRLTSDPTGAQDEAELPDDGASLPPWRVLSAHGRRARTY